jgi:NAD(P)-dependent dehydrogenase (short-subunit alcohol dehydrogenase family)
MNATLKGRTALITGAGRGIGRGIALRLARDGADVAINYRADRDAAEATAEEARGFGVRAEAIAASIDSFEHCQSLADETVSRFGRIDILVNNAGIASRGRSVADTDPGEFLKLLTVHAIGAAWMCKVCAPHLRAHKRSDIVFISSVATSYNSANGAPYTMGKAAMEALAYTVAKEERAHGVRVNIVAPSLTVTDMGMRLSRAAMGVNDIHELDAKYPFGRVSVPEDVAAAVAFLVSDDNPYVSGQRIAVDGAMGG